jgi:peptidoglycan/xylan/chitin deacetylase (PgdA/CDA1 family)
MTRALFRQALDDLATKGATVNLWLRDDDAVIPTPALARLLALTEPQGVPLTLAVIPEETDHTLADHLARRDRVSVAVHGWSHRSYSQPPAKKQELGLDRPSEVVLAELAQGLDKLSVLYGEQLLPMLVPPWNRIASQIVEQLAGLGFECLSVFGREKPAPLPLINTHVDVMDWRGTRGGRPSDELFGDLAAIINGGQLPAAIGILTHHLVHDAQAWAFLGELIAETSGHPACRWVSAREVIATT